MKNIYTLIITGLIAFNTYSQTSSYPVTIPSTTVHATNLIHGSALVIDNSNNKWIGFNAGTTTSFQLLRYNGSQWDTFPVFNAISATNKVNALAVDAANNIWIGSNMGLTKYDGTSFTTYNTTNSTLINDTVISLACNSGNVYAGTYKGLSVYNGTGFTNYNHAGNGMKSDTIYCITAESASAIWLGNKFGIDKFNGSNFVFNYVTAGNIADTVNCIYLDSINNKWIGTNGHGLIKYDNTNFYNVEQLYSYTLIEDLYEGGIGYWPHTVKSLCKGPSGGVLLGMTEGSNAPLYYTPLGSIELKSNTLNVYIGFSPAAANSTTVGYAVMQHDLVSDKIFYIQYDINYGGTAVHPVLYSFDASLSVVTPPSITSLGTTSYNSAFLDINNVNALITDNSNQHWDLTEAKYFTPKQNNTSPLFSSAMWIGGYTAGNLHMAAMTYRQNGYDFWPGPINPVTDAIDSTTLETYNHVWKVNRFDIANFMYAWAAGTVQSGVFVPPASIVNWPGNSPYTGKPLAPYVDFNGDGTYNYLQGDYPLIKGDQMIWSVYNDIYNHHGETGGLPLGIEVHASAYAFTCPGIADSNTVLNNTTFYNYQIVNYSSNQYDSTRMGLWVDSDLGDYQDDYVGCNVMNNYGYTYNGENYDYDTGPNPGYHSNLPVFACNVLNGPKANPNDGIDNNNNGVIDEANEHCLMDGFNYYNNSGSSINGNPSGTAGGIPYYNLMNNLWENGTPMTYGASGLRADTGSNKACRFLYPGTSDPYGIGLGGSIASPVVPPGGTVTFGPSGWTEAQAGNPFGDRRFIVNIGPFTMKPDSIYNFDYALVFTQDSANCYGNAICPITRAVSDNQRVRNWFNNNTFPTCLSLAGLGIKENNAALSLDFKLYPNPANNVVYIEFEKPLNKVTIEVYDMLGKIVRGFQYNDLVKYASIPVSDLQSGVYMVKIQTEEGPSIKKFVKE